MSFGDDLLSSRCVSSQRPETATNDAVRSHAAEPVSRVNDVEVVATKVSDRALSAIAMRVCVSGDERCRVRVCRSKRENYFRFRVVDFGKSEFGAACHRRTSTNVFLGALSMDHQSL